MVDWNDPRILSPEEIKARIDKFNEGEKYDWSVFDDVPPIQQVEVMYPFYINKFAFPAREFGIINDQETLNRFRKTMRVLDEFEERSKGWAPWILAQQMIGRLAVRLGKKDKQKKFDDGEYYARITKVIDNPYIPGNATVVFEDGSMELAKRCKLKEELWLKKLNIVFW